jgi:hypothetical protein
MTAYEYPDRDEWAKRQRTFYADLADSARDAVTTRILDYATQEEIGTAVAELRARWTVLGRRLREINKALQPYTGLREFDGLSEEQQQLHCQSRDLQDQRKSILKVAKEWGQNPNPYLGEAHFDSFLCHSVGLKQMASDGACPTYRSIIGRWAAAKKAAEDAARIRTENKPIDDAAWARELERRADLEAYFRRGPVVRRVGAP